MKENSEKKEKETLSSKMGKLFSPKEKKPLSLKEIGIQRLVIILLCGIFLILVSVPDFFSSFKGEEEGSTSLKKETVLSNSDDTEQYILSLEKKLKKVLKKVEGIGDVEVMITLKSSKEVITLKDNPYRKETVTESDSVGGQRESEVMEEEEQSVLVTTKEGENVPYILKEIEPELEGVIVIAQGGGNSNIKNEIIEAVEVLFNIPVHKIKVMKMNY